MASKAREIRRLASEGLGFGQRRPGQLEGVQSVLAGDDTLCIMSTGSSVGYRTLDTSLVSDRGLLTPVNG